tara:strand:+ start:393 stop:671 length:279 start_codon:yes stop_codon:yes gene_type:complete
VVQFVAEHRFSGFKKTPESKGKSTFTPSKVSKFMPFKLDTTYSGIVNFKIIQKGDILHLYGITNRWYYKQMAEYWTAKRSGLKINSRITVEK